MESVRRKLNTNPRVVASTLSVLLFLWTYDIFKKGYQRTIELTDLFETLPEDRSAKLGDRLEKSWVKQKNAQYTNGPSLTKAIVMTFWKNYLFLGILCVLNDIIIRLTQPYLLGQLLLYFRKDTSMTYSEALWYAVSIVLLNALSMMTVNHYFIGCFHMGMQIRISLCSLIYRKALKLSQTALRETAAINLLSNDVSRFDLLSFLLHSMWTAPIMTLIIGYFLWLQARWAGMIGIAVVFIVVPIQSYTGKLSSIFRLKTAIRTDKRIKFMEEIITGVRVIKMFGWEVPFGKMIDIARKRELNILRKNSFVRGLYMTFALFTTRLAVFCTMVAIYFMYGSEDITAAKIFVIAAYFHLIAHFMSQLFVRGIAEIAEAYVSVKRLEKFLLCEEVDTGDAKWNEAAIEADDVALSVDNLCAKWKTELKKSKETEELLQQRDTLDQISLTVQKGALIGIIGPVGSGKSSFLQALLKELPVKNGSINIAGSVSYACQEPWIFSASVKQNIVFCNPFDENRYNRIIRSCALDVDIQSFEGGDKMLIGDRGISLSGGQKARINLARCLYRNADIYLFDDPLSAVDTHVGRHLFNECIGPNGFLCESGCTRILVTHQVHFLKEADFVVVLRNGMVDFYGTPEELANLEVDFSEFIRMKHDDDTEETGTVNETQQLHVDSKEEVAKLEDVSKNKNQDSAFISYFRSGANVWSLTSLFMLFLLSQVLASGCDFWVAFWTAQEENRNFQRNELAFSDDRNISQTDNSVTGVLTTYLCMFIHGVLVTALFIVALARSIGFYTICLRAAHKIHNAMFKGIISTSLRFFDTNPIGRILNLFSKDLGTVDESLPKSLLDASQSLLIMTGSICLTLTVNTYFLVPIIVVGIIFMVARKIYLKTSRDMKRIEGITRSPVFTHLAATMQGLPTIRALQAQNVLIEEFDNHQDLHSSCWFLFVTTSSAFGLCLDFLCLLIISCVTFTFLFATLGSEVGLAITQVMALTGMLQWGIRQSADVSNNFMAIERIIQYRDLPPEQLPGKLEAIPNGWPMNGKIEFRNVSYRYSETLSAVLKNVNLVIQPNEKIGIVGRTGAGKSSLIGAIFRLAIVEGDILIDGINTKSIDLNDLRSKISIIPQDPMLFSGSLRRNLDPFEMYSDTEIWKALEDVELKHIADNPEGLHLPVLLNGSNFSVGEKQLLCLARAILRKSKILIADEATGNVSLSADKIIQQKIREKFVDCTVLTIAHRLNTIIDSDRIIVMGNGEIVEFGSPSELLQSKSGTFYGMISALGKNEAERLTQLAVSKHK
ncbi:ATP-binding cassette subfamily C member 4 [Pseudolycoriella hygida]|uniref:ATP-binding cassette subfamily C member 4 n=1 Tax=Pseudolycoriella hygida TaxID=35572 RepID=A0A9Q0S1M4_9DIPT|nr:ATP-binding cassette subfamily C member 4 [Pseudolycoriella hygida]